MTLSEIRRCSCNLCGGDTDHDAALIGTFFEKEDTIRTVSVVTCRGCKSVAICEEKNRTTASGVAEVEMVYNPPRLRLQQPKWVTELETTDNNLYGLLVELYSAAHDGQQRLLAMGVRAAVDHVMTRVLGDIGGFEQKLDKMVEEKYISEKQKEMLTVVIDAASAAAHRGYRPPFELLRQMVSVMEYMINQYYIAGPMLAALKIQIPPRPPRAAGIAAGAGQSKN